VGDYAASIGTTGFDHTVVFPNAPSLEQNGVSRAAKGIRLAEITDGTTHTLLVGEKHVPLQSFGLPPWDCGIYDGHNPTCSMRAAGPGFPLAQTFDDPNVVFGSHHPDICQFVFCDGHVQSLLNSTAPLLLGLLAQRNDGLVPDF
jgi:prepilin-type processing-associated H-X9-DG protein